MKPWHLKATYQLYDLKGNPTEQGTWNYWWASPKVNRSSWARGDAEHSEWVTADGGLYRKDRGSPLRHFEKSIIETLVSPLPANMTSESSKESLDLKMLPPKKPELACVVVTPQWLVDGKPQAPSSGALRYYCFDPPTLALRMVSASEMTEQFNQLVKTQGHYLARQVVMSTGKVKLFSASVDTIEAVSPEDAVFSPPSDSILQQRTETAHGNEQTGVKAGPLVKKTQPEYPILSKMAREQGVVILSAVIGTDGSVHDLEVLASPSTLLAESAVDAVKKWKYSPYLLNGVPVEVETVVNVVYALGR